MTQASHDEPTATSTEELREQVEQTRAELGDTVEALAAKTHLKDQAAARADELKGQAVRRSMQLKKKVVDLVRRTRDRLPVPVKDRGALAAERARVKAFQAGQLWDEKVPESVRQKTAQGVQAARDNHRILLAASGGAVVVWFARRRLKG
ncbi:DUF3618 domain-containing protein [Streptomyces sp. NPDC096198]|uniref:DUF3618 domain-containing protein n=1 Tax=Streptomyces sp. NPDC096198 TaxID=3366080 RepID=UPI00381334AA